MSTCTALPRGNAERRPTTTVEILATVAELLLGGRCQQGHLHDIADTLLLRRFPRHFSFARTDLFRSSRAAAI